MSQTRGSPKAVLTYLDCSRFGSLDFNFSFEILECCPVNPPKKCKRTLFAGGSLQQRVVFFFCAERSGFPPVEKVPRPFGLRLQDFDLEFGFFGGWQFRSQAKPRARAWIGGLPKGSGWVRKICCRRVPLGFKGSMTTESMSSSFAGGPKQMDWGYLTMPEVVFGPVPKGAHIFCSCCRSGESGLPLVWIWMNEALHAPSHQFPSHASAQTPLERPLSSWKAGLRLPF